MADGGSASGGFVLRRWCVSCAGAGTATRRAAGTGRKGSAGAYQRVGDSPLRGGPGAPARRLSPRGWGRSAAARLSHQVVRCGDFLTEGPQDPAYDVVVGNPPHLRFLSVPQPLRAAYERELPPYALADLLHAFLDRCARVLRADGELAMVTADRWLFNEGARGVREAIGRRFRLARLDQLDAASSFYRPKLRRAGSAPRVHPAPWCCTHRGARRSPSEYSLAGNGLRSSTSLRADSLPWNREANFHCSTLRAPQQNARPAPCARTQTGWARPLCRGTCDRKTRGILLRRFDFPIDRLRNVRKQTVEELFQRSFRIFELIQQLGQRSRCDFSERVQLLLDSAKFGCTGPVLCGLDKLSMLQ